MNGELYVEWGYKACEKGWNIQRTMEEYRKLNVVAAGICPDCKGLIKIRNPTGMCDHLHYPEYKKKLVGEK